MKVVEGQRGVEARHILFGLFRRYKLYSIIHAVARKRGPPVKEHRIIVGVTDHSIYYGQLEILV